VTEPAARRRIWRIVLTTLGIWIGAHVVLLAILAVAAYAACS
jgi:hypothetical protein